MFGESAETLLVTMKHKSEEKKKKKLSVSKMKKEHVDMIFQSIFQLFWYNVTIAFVT